MNENGFIMDFYSTLLRGDPSPIYDLPRVSELNRYAKELYDKEFLSSQEIYNLGTIIRIGNIVFNNTDLDDCNQTIENEFYDQLLEKFKRYSINFQIGAIPVHFENLEQSSARKDTSQLILFADEDKMSDMLFKDNLLLEYKRDIMDLTEPDVQSGGYVSDKKYKDTAHGSPELVGSLDKCKYVLNSQAKELDVFDDPSVKILERDFFNIHFIRNIVSQTSIFRMILELKYDGVSVEASISNGMIVRAASRGDTGLDLATDLTPIFYGYTFPRLPKEAELDCKFEAIMTYENLEKYNQAKGKTYKNARSAIVGLTSSNEGYLYREFISLVPLKIATYSVTPSKPIEKLNRIEEIEFMNEYLRKDVLLKYSYIEGDYSTILFLIKKFVEEAEFARSLINFMYDGIVVSYLDESLISALGRDNSINKYSVAVKFNAMKKQTRFLGYTFNVGQDGIIIPMFHYDPVVFLGTVHTKSSGSSYERFMMNSLKVGDIIEVEYRNDVMPYVTKPALDVNIDNPNPVIPFLDACPSCNGSLTISDSGKSIKCINLNCEERNIQRVSNMLSKLGVKDFSTATVAKLKAYGLVRLMHLSVSYLCSELGDVNGVNLFKQLRLIDETPMQDSVLIGSLGFTGIAQETWKKILMVHTLQDILIFRDAHQGNLSELFSDIKGIGPATIKTIEEEFSFFYEDVEYIAFRKKNLLRSVAAPKIRITGFRDAALMEELCSMGYDASDSGVTKDTAILLIPSIPGYSSSKLSKVGANTIIVDINTFRNDMGKILQSI